jgi:thioredoxin
MIAPILEQLAKEYAGRIKIAKLNVDENPLTASKFAIKSIPTMLLFKNGERVNTLVGALSKSEIEKQLNSIL